MLRTTVTANEKLQNSCGIHSKTFGVATRALDLSLKYFCQIKTKESHKLNLKMSFAMIE